MRNLGKANRVVKWHGTNGTIPRRPKSKSDSSLGLRKLGPERRGKQGELAGTCTCLEVHPEGLVGSVANAGSHDPAHIL
jgi:hypothetical protein